MNTNGKPFVTEVSMSDIVQKAWRLVDSCQTHKQARGAIRYLELLAEAYPEIDVSPMRKELKTLFDLKEIA